VLRAVKIAAQTAITPPKIWKKPLLSDGMKIFRPYHKKNMTVNQSAIIDRSIALSPHLN
jgi:hypothetical protein